MSQTRGLTWDAHQKALLKIPFRELGRGCLGVGMTAEASAVTCGEHLHLLVLAPTVFTLVDVPTNKKTNPSRREQRLFAGSNLYSAIDGDDGSTMLLRHAEVLFDERDPRQHKGAEPALQDMALALDYSMSLRSEEHT